MREQALQSLSALARRCLAITPWCAAVLLIVAVPPVASHEVYLMNSNHTDYNWNATATEYDAAMLAELDYYLQQIADTAGAPPEEQARYTPDNWWWLYLYEQNRTPEQFDRAARRHPVRPHHHSSQSIRDPLRRITNRSGHPRRILPREDRSEVRHRLSRSPRRSKITPAPGAWPAYGRVARSSTRGKAFAAVYRSAPARFDDELFIWQGPDDKTLLFKWYNLIGVQSGTGEVTPKRGTSYSSVEFYRFRDRPHPVAVARDPVHRPLRRGMGRRQLGIFRGSSTR